MRQGFPVGLSALLLMFVPLAQVSAQGKDPGAAARALLERSRRIVFLGDSITAAGHYVAFFDAWLLSQGLKRTPTVIDAGLSSETVSGLSEEGHAGGRFPRPDLAERLDRILAVTKPDLVIACYGMNCGIYQPFDEGRFRRYRQGIESLQAAVKKAGARLVLVTPPFYDDQRSPKPFSYNAVLDRYSRWLVDQRKKGVMVVDLHMPMTKEVTRRRRADPKFTFQRDGVHPNEQGHWFIASRLLDWFGDEVAASASTPQEMLAAHGVHAEALPLVRRRVNILRDAYVSAAGHKRPGVAAGAPIPEAEKEAEELSRRIRELPVPAK